MMNFIFKPTLEHIALMKLVTALWNQHDIRVLMEEFSNTTEFLQVDDNVHFIRLFRQRKWISKKEEKWQMIAAKVIEKIPQHIMHIMSLKTKTISYVKSIGLQILRWMEYHCKCFYLNFKLPNEFCWTLQGTIDKKKTAELLIKDEDIDIITRDKLACVYCIDLDIFQLRNKMPKRMDCRDTFNSSDDRKEKLEMAFVGFWEHCNKENMQRQKVILLKVSDSNSQFYYKKALICAAFMANKAAIEYFLSKVHYRELLLVAVAVIITDFYNNKVNDNIFDSPPKEYYGEVLCSLLSQMNDAQQLTLFERCRCNILLPLLEWPCQTFFVQTASHLCRIFPEDEKILCTVANGIFHKTKLCYKDYNYRKMYGELWQQLPNDYKSLILNSSSIAHIVLHLLEIKDSENIKLMFEHANIIERNELIFRITGFLIYFEMTMTEYKEWDLLKFFVQLCITSKDEMIKCKERVMEYVSKPSLEDKLDKFSQVLDDLVHAFDKRKSVDEDECSTSKRLCNSNSM